MVKPLQPIEEPTEDPRSLRRTVSQLKQAVQLAGSSETQVSLEKRLSRVEARISSLEARVKALEP